ncbi:MAG: hypothetical protein K2O24_09680 [Muribaculaceae bacterium]|nr:hypothetical protein [Muribaculaceae bacterium]
MKKRFDRIIAAWRTFRESGRLHNVLVFLGFLGIATVFWFFMAMNDNVQRGVGVNINIVGVPDSVKFVSDPPKRMHVVVRDKGTTLIRTGGFRTPGLTVNFKDFARDGALVFNHADLMAALKSTFGGTALILSTSIDSIRAPYVSSRGRAVPVDVVFTGTPAAGSVIAGEPTCTPTRVMAYGPKNVLDTLRRVFTQHLERRNLHEPTEVTVKLHPVAGVRLEPQSVTVRIPVEPLVAKEFTVPVSIINLPEGNELLLFPSTVRVTAFVPMSRFSDTAVPVEAWVDYRDVALPTDKVPVNVRSVSGLSYQASTPTDSLEYAVVR